MTLKNTFDDPPQGVAAARVQVTDGQDVNRQQHTERGVKSWPPAATVTLPTRNRPLFDLSV